MNIKNPEPLIEEKSLSKLDEIFKKTRGTKTKIKKNKGVIKNG